MENFWDIFKPKALVDFGGLTLVLLVIFIENGLFFGFFLPGDSLLFTVGLLCYLKVLDVELATLILSIAAAAFAQNRQRAWAGIRDAMIILPVETGSSMAMAYRDVVASPVQVRGFCCAD